MDNIIEFILNANLSFTGILLALIGIIVPLYLNVVNESWRKIYKYLLLIFALDFVLGVIINIACLLLLVDIPVLFFSLTLDARSLILFLFATEMMLLAIGGMWFIIRITFSGGKKARKHLTLDEPGYRKSHKIMH